MDKPVSRHPSCINAPTTPPKPKSRCNPRRAGQGLGRPGALALLALVLSLALVAGLGVPSLRSWLGPESATPAGAPQAPPEPLQRVAYPPAQPGRDQPPTVHRLGHFEIKIKPGKWDWGGYAVDLSAAGQPLLATSSDHQPEAQTLTGMPHAACQTLIVTLPSGGSAGYADILVATRCPDAESAIQIAGMKNNLEPLDANGDGVQELEGWFDSQSGISAEMPFSTASHPSMTRILVFDQGQWRLDRPGEFSDYYQQLLNRPESWAHAGADFVAAAAIRKAYYSYMSQPDLQRVAAILAESLPEDWRPFLQRLPGDIRQGADQLSPVKALLPPRKP